MYLLLIVLIRAFLLWNLFSTDVEAVESTGIIPQPSSTSNDTRIIGGYPIGIESAPWQAAIINNGFLECGGSVISELLIMTAAHCVKGSKIKNLNIRTGSKYFQKGGQVRQVSKVVINASYGQGADNNHDIAIVKLHYPLDLNKYVRPVRLAQRYQPPSKYATVTGWGVTREQNYNPSHNLRAVRVDFITLKQCQNDYRSKAKVTANMICTGSPNGGRDACQGDSGGPLVRSGIQYGIVSFGIGCGKSNFPGVYTSVAAQKHWINKVMANI